MNSQKSRSRVGSFFIFSFLLIIFISGFLLLSSLYRFSVPKQKTVVLDKDLFSHDSLTKDREKLQIKDVIKLDTPYPIWSPEIINDHAIIFQTNDQVSATSYNKMYQLDLSSQNLESINQQSDFGLVVSPDGKKLLFANYDDLTNTFKSFLYDIETEEVRQSFDGFGGQFTPNSGRYIAIENNSLFLHNVTSGEKQKLIDMKEFLSRDSNSFLSGKVAAWNFSFSTDGSTIFFTALHKEGTALFTLDLDQQKTSPIKLLIAENINKVVPLSDGTVLLSGDIKGENGIFLFNPKNKTIKQILSGSIYNFDATPEGRLAYMITNTNGVSNLHLAFLNKAAIESDEMIYSDLKYVSFLKWSKNGRILFCVSDGINSSSIYRFSF